MRKFFLQNALGQKWNLNDLDSFLHTVKGLGQGYSTTYTQIGSRFIKKKCNIAQKKITGKVRFRGYEEFGAFSRFIQHKPLILVYGSLQTRKIYPPVYPKNNDYLLDVVISSLEKTELETGGLQSKITFESLGTYYRMQEVYGVGTVVIDSDTVLESGVRMEIEGPCFTPHYQHYIDGVMVGSGRFACEIGAGSSMVIDTTKLPYEVMCYSTDGSAASNLYGTSDFSTKRFIVLGYGKNEIRFAHDGINSLNVSVEAKLEYESV